MSDNHTEAVEELLRVRDELIDRIGYEPEPWCEELELDAEAIRHVAAEVALNAVTLSASPYHAAGTGFMMGFLLGAAVATARAQEATA